ncbi:MAG: sulfite exporter TauE/SafE family protein [Clostridia bacterium]|nr:sulfite exporter TauE/SafE family protein [Clostridia bacterium]MEE1184957.1 sulfite exporter TauE/SafE family protein [Acutalibacteraceae bacterium]
MEGKKKFNLKTAVYGISIGLVNGLLGAGGGMLAVPLLKNTGFEQKEAQENAIAVILPISVLSASLYLLRDYVNIADALPYIPTGLIGAVIGTVIIKKISPNLLKKLFGGFMIYAGIRLLLK